MYLKSIELQGFKTFAKKAELVFEPGITAIVGPNGSGKSNLVDAIRWVLGERSARELRGSRMEEVVYSGGARRSASGMAEVRILIDNSDGRLPVPYAEVEVIRRGYRSGESEYRMNGGRCRLRDVEELFGSTGLAQQGYSMVAQDDVDHIIQTTPTERRALIEEAAGVRGLHGKRQEALNKLRDAGISITRLGDLAGELQPRVEELRTQADAARRHAEGTARLGALRGSLLRGEWLAARQRVEKARTRMGSLEGAAGAARADSAAFGLDYEAHKEKLAQAHDARLVRERHLGSLRLAATHAHSRVELLGERLAAAQAAAADAEGFLANSEGRLASLEAEAATTQEEVDLTQIEGPGLPGAELATGEPIDLEAAISRHREAAAAVEAARSEHQAAISAAQRLEERVSLIDSLAAHGELSAASAGRLVRLLEAPGVRRAAIEAGISDVDLDHWLEEGRAERATLAGARDAAGAELGGERSRGQDAERALAAARRVVEVAAAQLEEARQASVQHQAKQLALFARADSAKGRLERAEVAVQRQRAEVERVRGRVDAMRQGVRRLTEEHRTARAEAVAATRALEAAPAEAEAVEVESLTRRLVEMEKAHLERQVALAHKEEALVATRVQLEEEEEALAELTTRVSAAGEGAGEETEVDWEKTQREIARLERQLAQMGLVNPLAIEEFERDNGRLSAISGQLDDLVRARDGLQRIAGELGTDIERRFEAVFGAVAFNFQETFAALFPGGKATLKLDDPEADEPGVEILAQPASKRMRGIRLLSGGERALTALAFILALEKVNPSPFYVFDEVDAPLDDANIKRFVNLLRTMATDDQFILVTHNHQTMTAAQALYGVTLEDSGVSRLVSVRLQGEEIISVQRAS